MNSRNIILLQQRILQRKFIYSAESKVQFSIKNNDKDEKCQPEVTKESLQWRTTAAERGDWYSKLKVFASDSNSTDIIKFLQSPIDLRPSAIKKWYFRKKEETEIYMQQYIPERNRILGDNLAASHFIVFRGGRVKFHGQTDWIVQDEDMEIKLPNKFVPHLIVQAIDCSKVNLHYEGLANFQGLDKLEWLNLNGCTNMDDWCMDRISFLFRDSMKYLDIRNCKNITYRGIGALYKTTNLNTLLIDDLTKPKELEMTCLMLQEMFPNLNIKTSE